MGNARSTSTHTHKPPPPPPPPPHPNPNSFYGSMCSRPNHIDPKINGDSVKEMITEKISPNKCKHLMVELWKLDRCIHCGTDLPKTRLKREQMLSRKIQLEDSVSNDKVLLNGAVRIDWLIAFTYDHNAWNWTTARVVRDIIRPATLKNRCRYSSLTSVKPYTGPPSVFMSHCWAACWGDLVLAAIHGAKKDRYVWIDIFAVRQWPGNVADLNFREVISQCKAVIVAVSKITELCRIELVELENDGKKEDSQENEETNQHDDDVSKVEFFLSTKRGDEIKKTIAFFRLWCVVELSAAVLNKIPVIVKGGVATRIHNRGPKRLSDVILDAKDVNIDSRVHTDAITSTNHRKVNIRDVNDIEYIVHGIVNGRQNLNYKTIKKKLLGDASSEGIISVETFEKYKADIQQLLAAYRETEYFYDSSGVYFMMANLAMMVDIESSKSLLEEDRIREMKFIREHSSVDSINRILVGVVRGAATSLRKNVREVDAAVCGEEEALHRLLHCEMNRIHTKAGKGRILEVLAAAASGGRFNVVEIVLNAFDKEMVKMNGNENQNNDPSAKGSANFQKAQFVNESKALWRACRGAHIDVAEMLIVKGGGDVNIAGNGNSTPLWIACSHGSTDTVRMLLKYACNPYLKDDNGLSPMRISQMLRHQSTIDLLVNYGVPLEKIEENDVAADIIPLYRAASEHQYDNKEEEEGDHYETTSTTPLVTQRNDSTNPKNTGSSESKENIRKRFSHQSTGDSIRGGARASLRTHSHLMRLSSEITEHEIKRLQTTSERS
jgi:hypothetical protein